MTETTIAVSALKALGPVLSVLVNTPWKRNSRHEIDNYPIKFNGIRIKTLVEKAKGVLDNGKVSDLKSLTNLATLLTEGEIYGDIIKYISHRKFEGNITWDNFEKKLDELEQKLKDELDKHPESQLTGHEEGESSGHEMEGDPPGNVRRSLLYLSCFPTNYVFNRKRISRLLVAHEFIAADKPLLQQLANWLEPAERSWDGNGPPNHFLIGNDVENRTVKWPEGHNSVHKVLTEGIDSIKDQIFTSLIGFGGQSHTFKLKERGFILLRILSLRNVGLEQEICLKHLSLLKHLDLKYTNVRKCSWLEALEELEMLDLRYTYVQQIPDNCLQKLGKLQHLLLGYPRNEDVKDVSRLAGAILNTEKLKSENLETLRAIRQPKHVIAGSVDKVVDLSVTDLDPKGLENFWKAVGKFQNLTSLGVSVTKGTVITLQDCPDNLKKKLERLRMEGQIVSTSSQPQSGLAKLSQFERLIDLTLASDKPISIPTLTSLLCLRLYGYKVTNCQIHLEESTRPKKVVIGDMKKVKKIEISSAVIETVTTLKLSDLPNFRELVCLDTKHPLLRLNFDRKTEGFKKIQPDKTIFLKGLAYKQIQKTPLLKIYHYDMKKQCYKEIK